MRALLAPAVLSAALLLLLPVVLANEIEVEHDEAAFESSVELESVEVDNAGDLVIPDSVLGLGLGDLVVPAPGPPASRCLLAPGRAVELPPSVAPRSFALAPALRGLVFTDGAVHVKDGAQRATLLGRLGLAWRRLLGRAPRPTPYAFLLAAPSAGAGAGSPAAAWRLQRRLEFPERTALPYGVAGAGDGRVGVTFYSAAGVELWQGRELESKLTMHDFSIKPAVPVFDSAGSLWVPFTIADRLDEEGENVIAVWAYEPDGSRWEVFPRRQFAKDGVRFPHTLHLDAAGRVFAAGIAGKWPWFDGTYGLELREGVRREGEGASLMRLDVLDIATAADAGGGAGSDRRARAYAREQGARFCEQNGGDCKDGQPLDDVDEGRWRGDLGIRAVLAPLRSYEFPSPVHACIWPLFVLTGDGHAICSCYESDTLLVLRYGVSPGEAAAEGIEAGDEAGAGGAPNAYGLSEAGAPPEFAGGIALLPEARAAVVQTIRRPFGVISIGAIQMDPSGDGFAILDKATRRLWGAPWPWTEGADAKEHYTVDRVELIPHDA